MTSSFDYDAHAKMIMFLLIDFTERCGLLDRVHELEKKHGISPVALYLRSVMRGSEFRRLRPGDNVFEHPTGSCHIVGKLSEEARAAYYKIFDEIATKSCPRVLVRRTNHNYMDNVAGETRFTVDFPPISDSK